MSIALVAPQNDTADPVVPHLGEHVRFWIKLPCPDGDAVTEVRPALVTRENGMTPNLVVFLDGRNDDHFTDALWMCRGSLAVWRDSVPWAYADGATSPEHGTWSW